jgi:hypothetical protein
MKDIDKNWLVSKSHLSQRQIAKEIGCCQDTVRRLFKKFDICPKTKLVNLSEKKFNNWLVLSRDLEKTNGTFWICRCLCGRVKSINAGSLVSGNTKQCKHCSQWEGVGDFSKDHFSQICRSAKTRNLEMSLTMEDLWSLFLSQKKLCALTGVELKFARNKHVDNCQTASLDRIDSNLGYIYNNVQWIHKDLQTMKFTMSQEKFFTWCELVTRYKNEKISSNII